MRRVPPATSSNCARRLPAEAPHYRPVELAERGKRAVARRRILTRGRVMDGSWEGGGGGIVGGSIGISANNPRP